MDWSEIHEKRGIGPLSLPLAFFSLLYGLGAGLRARVYRGRGRRRLPGFTVSLGNITAGGTGKTPAAVMLARWAANQGFRPVVLSRGYGGRHGREVLEVTDGRTIKAGAEEAGDEPILMAANLPGVPIVVSRERQLAGLYAFERFQSDFFLLDDGFQHLGVERDLDLVLLHAASPFGNGRLLPWGPLREPMRNLSRASGFLITRWNGTRGERRWEEFLTRRFPGKPLFTAAHVPQHVVLGTERHSPGFLKGRRVFGFAGIARPEPFRKTLIEAGAEVAGFRVFGDHHRYTGEELRGLASAGGSSGADLLITTEKDWVRLERFGDVRPQIAFLTIAMKVLREEERFFRFVRTRYQETEALHR